MPQCLFPHCRNKHDLVAIPKFRKPYINSRGQRSNYSEQNQIINQQHHQMISILKEYRPDFIYDENKPTNYICIRHFHPSVLYNDGKRDRVVLGGLPTINLADNYKEQSNAQRLVLSVVDRMELDIKMKRKSVEPLEVTPKMQRRIDRFFINKQSIEEKIKLKEQQDIIFNRLEYIPTFLEKKPFNDWTKNKASNKFILSTPHPDDPTKFVTFIIELNLELKVVDIKISIPLFTFCDLQSYSLVSFRYIKNNGLRKFSEITKCMKEFLLDLYNNKTLEASDEETIEFVQHGLNKLKVFGNEILNISLMTHPNVLQE